MATIDDDYLSETILHRIEILEDQKASLAFENESLRRTIDSLRLEIHRRDREEARRQLFEAYERMGGQPHDLAWVIFDQLSESARRGATGAIEIRSGEGKPWLLPSEAVRRLRETPMMGGFFSPQTRP